jgi:hypothetical protein
LLNPAVEKFIILFCQVLPDNTAAFAKQAARSTCSFWVNTPVGRAACCDFWGSIGQQEQPLFLTGLQNEIRQSARENIVPLQAIPNTGIRPNKCWNGPPAAGILQNNICPTFRVFSLCLLRCF